MKKSLALFLTSLIVTLVVVVIVYVGYVKIHALTTVEGAFVGEWRGENKERADVITFRADGGYRRQTQFKAFDAGFYSEPARSETASGVWRCKRDPNGPNGIDAGTLYLSNSKECADIRRSGVSVQPRAQSSASWF